MISDPAFAAVVAGLLSDGLSRQQVMHELSERGLAEVKDPTTITRWRKDPRVKGLLTTLINDRVREVTRKVDAKIAAILERDDLTVRELLDIRKEFLGGALREETQKADENVVNAAMDAAANPAFQNELAALFAKLQTGELGVDAPKE